MICPECKKTKLLYDKSKNIHYCTICNYRFPTTADLIDIKKENDEQERFDSLRDDMKIKPFDGW